MKPSPFAAYTPAASQFTVIPLPPKSPGLAPPVCKLCGAAYLYAAKGRTLLALTTRHRDARVESFRGEQGCPRPAGLFVACNAEATPYPSWAFTHTGNSQRTTGPRRGRRIGRSQPLQGDAWAYAERIANLVQLFSPVAAGAFLVRVHPPPGARARGSAASRAAGGLVVVLARFTSSRCADWYCAFQLVIPHCVAIPQLRNVRGQHSRL